MKFSIKIFVIILLFAVIEVSSQQNNDEISTSENSPPQKPQITLLDTKKNSITLKVEKQENENATVNGFKIFYKSLNDDWKIEKFPVEIENQTLKNIKCASRYQVYAKAYNLAGDSEQSEILNFKTKGNKPIQPEQNDFIEIESNKIILKLSAWNDGGCKISYFVVEHKHEDNEWKMISNNLRPTKEFFILDFKSTSRYKLRVTAYNDVGFTIAEYEYMTLLREEKPKKPKLTVLQTTENSFSLKIEKNETETAEVSDFHLHYTTRYMDFPPKILSLSEAQNYTIENLKCASKIKIFAFATNSAGFSPPTDLIMIETLRKINFPEKSQFIVEVSSYSVTLELSTFENNLCQTRQLAIANREKDETEWDLITSEVEPKGRFVILDLNPSRTYIMNVTAYTAAGVFSNEYEYSTLAL